MWIIQVLVRVDHEKNEWRDVRPTGGRRYEFATRDEAERNRRMCYGAPEHAGKSRIMEV